MADETLGPILGYRPRGRPPKALQPLPTAAWVPPEIAAARIGISLPTLWRAVAAGKLTPPSYPTEKSPRFHLPTLDADMERARALPSENEAGHRATRLAAARREKLALNASTAQNTPEAKPAVARHEKPSQGAKPAAANQQAAPASQPVESPAHDR